MPIYEFKCSACSNIDEILMRMSDPSPEGCSKCGASVAKIISNTSFSLKGEGWYVTDYKPRPKEEGQPAAAAPVTPPSTTTPAAASESGSSSGTPAESKSSQSAPASKSSSSTQSSERAAPTGPSSNGSGTPSSGS